MTRPLDIFVSALAISLAASAPVAGSAEGLFTRGAGNCHALALTFDLCPVKEGSGFDAPLVKFLVDHHIHATFFASGKWIAGHELEVRELIAEPFFEIGTHGEAHAHMPALGADAQLAEIRGPIDTLAERFHVRPTLFRPPYGEYNADTLREAAAAGQTVVTWSVVSGDPDPKLPPANIVAEVVRRARNGSVIVFHANGRGWHTSEIVPAVYQTLIESKRFDADTVSELRSCVK